MDIPMFQVISSQLLHIQSYRSKGLLSKYFWITGLHFGLVSLVFKQPMTGRPLNMHLLTRVSSILPRVFVYFAVFFLFRLFKILKILKLEVSLLLVW